MLALCQHNALAYYDYYAGIFDTGLKAMLLVFQLHDNILYLHKDLKPVHRGT